MTRRAGLLILRGPRRRRRLPDRRGHPGAQRAARQARRRQPTLAGLRRPAGLRHPAGGGPDRAADRRPAGPRRRAGDLALRAAPAGPAARLPGRPAGRRPQRRLRPLGHRLPRPAAGPAYAWLEDHLGFIPFFAGPASTTGRTILTAGIVLAIMVLPIITAITREIFVQTPKLHQEAALALGATRWEMIRLAVLPYARSGIVSALMLGLGRALGETMAVAMVLSASGVVTLQPDQQHQPLDDRGEHRPEVPRGHRPRGQRADRQRPGAVRDHLRGQLRGPRHRGAQREERTMRGNLKSTSTPRVPTPPSTQDPSMTTTPPGATGTVRHLALTQPRLPRWAGWLVAVAGRCRLRPGRPDPRLGHRRGAVLAVVLYAVALPVWSPAGGELPRRQGPTGHHAGLGGLRARAGPAVLADVHGAQERPRRHQRRVPHLLDAQRRRRGRRHLPRHRRHPARSRWPRP